MLAESDRHGCALGASIALTLDWRTIRVLLDISALRLALVPPTCTLPDLPGTARLAATVADTPEIAPTTLFRRQPILPVPSGLRVLSSEARLVSTKGCQTIR